MIVTGPAGLLSRTLTRAMSVCPAATPPTGTVRALLALPHDAAPMFLTKAIPLAPGVFVGNGVLVRVGVCEGVAVAVGGTVFVGVFVHVGVFVGPVGVFVWVGVFVGGTVFVGVLVIVGVLVEPMGVLVRVGVAVGPEGVAVGEPPVSQPGARPSVVMMGKKPV